MNDGGPAFPYSALTPDTATRQMVATMYSDNTGMSLRDYFAAAAMAGLMGNSFQSQSSTYAPVDFDHTTAKAIHCYQIADAMLEARKVK